MGALKAKPGPGAFLYTGLSLCVVPVRTYSPLMSWRLHPLSWKAVTSVLAVRARAVPAGLFAIASRTLVRTSAGRGERLNIEWSSAAPRPIAGQPLGSHEAEATRAHQHAEQRLGLA